MRVMVAVMVVLVFAGFWLFDTVALLQFLRAQIAAHSDLAIGLAGALGLAMLFSSWRKRRKVRRGKAARRKLGKTP